jgi:hypothetical protein
MIDPNAPLTPPPPKPRPPPAPPPTSAEQPQAEPQQAPPPAGGQLVASVLAAGRVLPSPALGARLSGDVPLTQGLDLNLAFSFLPEQRQDTSAGEVAFGLTFGGAGLCWRAIDSTTVRLSTCATLLAGALGTVVFDPVRATRSQWFWAGAALGPRVALTALAPLEIAGGVDLMTPFFQRDYLVERGPGDTVAVFSDPAVGGVGFLGLGARY